MVVDEEKKEGRREGRKKLIQFLCEVAGHLQAQELWGALFCQTQTGKQEARVHGPKNAEITQSHRDTEEI